MRAGDIVNAHDNITGEVKGIYMGSCKEDVTIAMKGVYPVGLVAVHKFDIIGQENNFSNLVAYMPEFVPFPEGHHNIEVLSKTFENFKFRIYLEKNITISPLQIKSIDELTSQLSNEVQ